MGRGKLTKEEINVLKKNHFVSDVNESRIMYTNEFKFYFMEEYNNGRKPTEIFRNAGFDTEILGSKRIERAAQRWRESFKAGSLGLYKDSKCSKEDTRKKLEDCLKIIEEQKEEIRLLKEKIKMLEGEDHI